MKSILSNADKCYLCGSRIWIQHHHIYGGPFRKISEANGFKAPLCRECHLGDNGVHANREKDLILKRACQHRYMATHTKQEFMDLIHKNYLEV